VVEYCLGNVTPTQRTRLADADVRTRGADCLDRCGRCYRDRFLVVDGVVVDGEAAVRRVAEG
jgi:uncharacterized protein YuzB (UPF0349 family)